MRSRAPISSLAAMALAVAAFLPVAAPAAPSNPVSCQQLEDKCLARVTKRLANEKPAANAVERPHLSERECRESYREAETTGAWPAHLPFNFAMTCAP